MIPRDRDLARLGPWPAGANNLSAEHSVPRGSFREGVNVNVADDGKVSRRDGYTKVFDAHEPHSVFGYGARAFFVEGTTLYGTELYNNGTFMPPLALYGDLQRDTPLAHCMIEPDIYVSDGNVALRLDPSSNISPWGLARPPVPTVVPGGTAGLQGGQYAVAIAFRRANGEEGPLSAQTVLSVGDGASLEVTFNGGILDGVDRIMVYATKPNGSELLLYGSVPVGTPTALITNARRGRPPVSEHLDPMPPGRFAAYFAGRLLVAVEDMVVWSEPHQYALTDPAYNYTLFSETTTGLGTVGETVDGFFVGLLSKTYFVSGGNPADARLSEVYPAGMVPGTLVHVPGARLPLEAPPTVPVPVWLATNGVVCAGLQDGTVLPLTETRFAANVGDSGAGVFEQRDGLNRYVVTTRNAAENVFAVQDSVSIEVVRNGMAP